MSNLSTVDLILIGGYLLLTLAFGLWLRRRATRSLEHYYLGGRKLPWPLLGVSGMANWFDLSGTMLIVSFLYLLGPRGLFIEFRGGAVLVLAFMLLWTGKWYRRSGCMTGAEWCEFRFGNTRGAEVYRAMSALFGIVFTVGLLAYLVRGALLFLGFFFPDHGMTATVAVIVISALYTMLSGYYGVVVNDLVQGFIIIAACVIVALLAFQLVPNAAALAELAERVTGNPAWLNSAPSLRAPMPPGYEAYELLALVSGFYLLRTLIDGAGAGDDSRYFAASSDRDVGLLSLLQMFTIAFRWPMMIGFAVLGLVLVNDLMPGRERTTQATAAIKAQYPALGEADWHAVTGRLVNRPEEQPALTAQLETSLGPRWRESLPLVGYHGGVNPEQVLPAVLRYRLPDGVRGFVMVAMLAALMSTLAGIANGVGSALFVRDIYQKFARPQASDRELILVSYAATASVVAIGFWMGLGAKNITHLWGWVMMGIGAGALAPKLLRLYWWRCTAWGCAIGIACGASAAVIQRLGWPDLPEWQQFTLTFGLGFTGVIVGSLLTTPTPADATRRFYQITRPFGWWAPFRAELPAAQRETMQREHRHDLCALPFALLTQITLFLLPMQLVIHAYDSVVWTGPLLLLGAAGLYWFWWRHLPARPAAAVEKSSP